MSTILGRSFEMERARSDAALFARVRDPVVIIGETGTGKGLLARAIHALAHAPSAPFRTVSGPELNEGLYQSQLFGHLKGAFTGADAARKGEFAAAAGGTLLVDELHLTPRGIQGAFLRAIQERECLPVGSAVTQPVTCRFIFTAQRPLDELVESERMLPDLRYRLGDFVIALPPLRERRGDIPALAARALHMCRERDLTACGDAPTDFAPGALVTLLLATWQGNVRDLESAVARASLNAANRHASVIEQADLPTRLAGPVRPLPPELRQVAVRWYFNTDRPPFTRSEVAAALGVSPGTIDNDRRALANGATDLAPGEPLPA